MALAAGRVDTQVGEDESPLGAAVAVQRIELASEVGAAAPVDGAVRRPRVGARGLQQHARVPSGDGIAHGLGRRLARAFAHRPHVGPPAQLQAAVHTQPHVDLLQPFVADVQHPFGQLAHIAAPFVDRHMHATARTGARLGQVDDDALVGPAAHRALDAVDHDAAGPGSERAQDVQCPLPLVDLQVMDARRQDVVAGAARPRLGHEYRPRQRIVRLALALQIRHDQVPRKGALVRLLGFDGVGAEQAVGEQGRCAVGTLRRYAAGPAQVQAGALAVAGEDETARPGPAGGIAAVAGVDDDDAVGREIPVGVDEMRGDAVTRLHLVDLDAAPVSDPLAGGRRVITQTQRGHVGADVGHGLGLCRDRRGRLHRIHGRHLTTRQLHPRRGATMGIQIEEPVAAHRTQAAQTRVARRRAAQCVALGREHG